MFMALWSGSLRLEVGPFSVLRPYPNTMEDHAFAAKVWMGCIVCATQLDASTASTPVTCANYLRRGL